MYKIVFFTLFLAQTALAQTSFFQVQTLPVVDSLSDDAIEKYQFQMVGDLKILCDTLQNRTMFLSESRAQAEQDLIRLKADTTSEPARVQMQLQTVKALKNAEKNSQKQFKSVESALAQCEKNMSIDPLERRKNILKIYKIYDNLRRKIEPEELRSVAQQASPDIAPEIGASPPPDTLKKSKNPFKKKKNTPKPEIDAPKEISPEIQDISVTDTSLAKPIVDKPKSTPNPTKKIATYDPAKDPSVTPPTPPCNFALQQRDEFSGEMRRELLQEEWFRHTNPVLKSYLGGKNQIRCEAALASVGQNTNLVIYIVVHDPNVRKSFGSLPKNGSATLKMIDGTLFTLYNLRGDDGTPIPDTDAVAYRAQFALTPTIVKKLRSTETDKLRINWSTGYEDYDIQQVDLLMRQAECLRM